MDRGLVIAGLGVVGALAATVALGALLTAGGAQLALLNHAPPAPHAVAHVSRVAKQPIVSVAQASRAQAGHAVVWGSQAPRSTSAPSGTRVASARAATKTTPAQPSDDDPWTDEPAPVHATEAVAEAAPAVDPEEDLSDFDLDLGPRGGSDDTGHRRR